MRAVVVMLMGLSAAVPAAAEKLPLTATVTWTDSTGATGSLPFQGVADGTALRGRVGGGAMRLRVDGVIADDGDIGGSLLTATGLSVGTFAATFDGTRLLGGYAVIDGEMGAWEAPADDLGSAGGP